MNVEPLVRVFLAGRDQPAHAIREHLGAAAGQRAEPHGAQLEQHFLVRQAAELRHVVDLARREQLQVDVRHGLVQLPHDLDVVVEVHVRALAADHVDLGEAGQLALAKRVRDELLGRVRVRALLLLGDGEGAELALHAADVRLVEVQVLDEVDVVRAAAPAACEVGQLPEAQDVVRLHQLEPVLEVEPLAGDDLLTDSLERRRAVEDGHQAVLSTTASAIASSSSRASIPSRDDRARSAYSRATCRASSIAPLAATRSSAPSSEPPASAFRTISSSRAARRSGSVGMPSRRSVPAILPVSTVWPAQSRQSSTIWNATPSERPNSPSSGRPLESRQAASNSFAVFSVQRVRYSSTVVSGRRRCPRSRPSPRTSPSAASARMATARESPVAASSAKARAKR